MKLAVALIVREGAKEGLNCFDLMTEIEEASVGRTVDRNSGKHKLISENANFFC